ncbi:MAG: methylated-DNA--[protein]-cysteine S-methyltransferase [Magnetococcus sp. WYHC-3]
MRLPPLQYRLQFNDAGALVRVHLQALPEPDADAPPRLLPACQAMLPPVAAQVHLWLEAYQEGRFLPVTFPLDPPGSDFARAVWSLLSDIAPGSTRTYGALAQQLGYPGAARAVGRALGANPLPLIRPCHRVVGARQAGGFSAPGGTRLKAALLAHEACLRTAETDVKSSGNRSLE